METVASHLFYSEYGADIEGVGSVYDPATRVTAFVAVRLHFPLNNRSEVLLFVHRPGDPPVTAPTSVTPNLYKGESVSCNQEGTGLRVVVNGHSTLNPDPNPHPAGTRLTTMETFVIPNVFV